jgi:hypothetical protein
MKQIVAMILAISMASGAMASGTCQGSFPNLITDICYDCMFPVTLAGGLLNFGVSGNDYDTGASNLSAGIPLGFWEPRYMPLLGGVDISAASATWRTWHEISWTAVHHVVARLQTRITKADKAGEWRKVRGLQKRTLDLRDMGETCGKDLYFPSVNNDAELLFMHTGSNA